MEIGMNNKQLEKFEQIEQPMRSGGWLFVFLILLLFLPGIFIFSPILLVASLLGILVTWISQITKLEEGQRSAVIFKIFVVVLGMVVGALSMNPFQEWLNSLYGWFLS